MYHAHLQNTGDKELNDVTRGKMALNSYAMVKIRTIVHLSDL